MKKKELITRVMQDTALTSRQVEMVLQSLKQTVSRELEKTGEVKIPDLVMFKVKQRAARKGRNLHTGETVAIPPKKVVSAKPCGVLAKRGW